MYITTHTLIITTAINMSYNSLCGCWNVVTHMIMSSMLISMNTRNGMFHITVSELHRHSLPTTGHLTPSLMATTHVTNTAHDSTHITSGMYVRCTTLYITLMLSTWKFCSLVGASGSSIHQNDWSAMERVYGKLKCTHAMSVEKYECKYVFLSPSNSSHTHISCNTLSATHVPTPGGHENTIDDVMLTDVMICVSTWFNVDVVCMLTDKSSTQCESGPATH